MADETNKAMVKALSVLISGLQAEIGAAATVELLDALRAKMVSEKTPPTTSQLEGLADMILAKSKEIQDA